MSVCPVPRDSLLAKASLGELKVRAGSLCGQQPGQRQQGTNEEPTAGNHHGGASHPRCQPAVSKRGFDGRVKLSTQTRTMCNSLASTIVL